MGQGSLKVTDIFTPDTLYDFESSSDEDESGPDETSHQDKPTADSDTTTEDAEVIEELTKVGFCLSTVKKLICHPLVHMI